MTEIDARRAARLAVMEDFRAAGRPRWIRVDGPSMGPLIAPGTWLLVDFGPVRPRIGRVVLAWLGHEFVVHRIVRVRGDEVLLQGDAESRADSPILRCNLYGGVRAIRANGVSTTVGCDGMLGQLIAIASRTAARAVVAAQRAVARLPVPIGRMLIRSIGAFARVPVQVVVSMALVAQGIAVRAGARST